MNVTPNEKVLALFNPMFYFCIPCKTVRKLASNWSKGEEIPMEESVRPEVYESQTKRNRKVHPWS